MKKFVNMNVLSWVLGTILCALGRVLCTKSGFGLSMIGAPPYIIHLKLVEKYPFFTQGTSEYVFQAVLFVAVCFMLGKLKFKHILSFGTAVILGLVIDMWLFVFGGGGIYENLLLKIATFTLGELITALAIAFLFRTTLPLQMYEVFVIECSEKFSVQKEKVKFWFDFSMLALSVVLALFLNENLNGVGLGTVIITLVNAPLINFFGKCIDRFYS